MYGLHTPSILCALESIASDRSRRKKAIPSYAVSASKDGNAGREVRIVMS